MVEGPQIVRPTAREDRPSALGLATLAVVAWVAGLALARASAEGIRFLPAPRIERISAAAPPAEDPPRLAPTSSSAAAPDESAPPAASAGTTGAPTEAPPEGAGAQNGLEGGPSPATSTDEAARAPERHAARHRVAITPGRVAYLRCDGAEVEPGLFPCPRDRALERRAWTAILALESCHDLVTSAPPAVGHADAWLIFDGPALRGVRMRASPGSQDVSTAMHTCLEDRLRGLRAEVGAERMTVSFRFDLE
jgi:hypothetical protein